MFTDGFETASKYIADVAGLINERVFAIGLGTADQVQPTALTALTNGTGGYLLLTGALGADDLFRLSKYYLQILAGVTNQDIVLDPEGAIQPGQKHRISFDLNEADIGLDAILLGETNLPIFRFALETPAGDVITPVVRRDRYITAQGVSFYRGTLPVPIGAGAKAGRWHAVLTLDEKYYKRYLASLDNYPAGTRRWRPRGTLQPERAVVLGYPAAGADAAELERAGRDPDSARRVDRVRPADPRQPSHGEGRVRTPG